MSTKKKEAGAPRKRGIRRRRPGWDKKQKELQEAVNKEIKAVEEKKAKSVKPKPVAPKPVPPKPVETPKPIAQQKIQIGSSINNPYIIGFERDIDVVLQRLYGFYFIKGEREVRMHKGNKTFKMFSVEDGDKITHQIWFDISATTILGRL